MLPNPEAFLVCSNLNPWDPKFLETAALGCYSYAIKNQDPDLLRLSESLYKKSYSVRPLITGFSFSSVGEQAEPITSSSLAELLPSNAELIPSYLYLESRAS